jgi:hypothetical protein
VSDARAEELRINRLSGALSDAILHLLLVLFSNLVFTKLLHLQPRGLGDKP